MYLTLKQEKECNRIDKEIEREYENEAKRERKQRKQVRQRKAKRIILTIEELISLDQRGLV